MVDLLWEATAVGPQFIPGAWINFLEFIPCSGIPYSALIQGVGALPSGKLYPTWGVDESKMGEVDMEEIKEWETDTSM